MNDPRMSDDQREEFELVRYLSTELDNLKGKIDVLQNRLLDGNWAEAKRQTQRVQSSLDRITDLVVFNAGYRQAMQENK
ncbi:MAG TPA: hypothetical protein VIY48_00180 [Candidatus Paceibacterota bacterium]